MERTYENAKHFEKGSNEFEWYVDKPSGEGRFQLELFRLQKYLLSLRVGWFEYSDCLSVRADFILLALPPDVTET